MVTKFIKIFKRIEYRLHFTHLIIILFLIISYFSIILLNANVLLKGEVDIGYKSYSGVVVVIDEGKIKGKLNNYLTTKHFNENCYLHNCGLPNGGKYLLREITFISINKKWFLLQVCIEGKLFCVKNLPNSFVNEYKGKLLSKVKRDVLFGFLTVFFVMIVSLYETKRYRNERASEKLN